MIKRIAWLSLILCAPISAASYILNEVRAVVNGPEDQRLILTLDIRPGLDNAPRTLRDIVLEELMILDAKRLRIDITDEDVNRYLRQLEKVQGYTQDQVKEFLKMIGYSYKEGFEQFRRKEFIDRVMDYRVRSSKKLAITKADVEELYYLNPDKQEATFTLSSAIFKTDLSKEDFEKTLKKDSGKSLSWNEPFSIPANALPSDKQFIKNKKPGEIVLIEPTKDGFEVTKLISKVEEKIMPLETGDDAADKQRFTYLENVLRQQRFKEVLENYQADLLKNANITFTYDADRIAVMGK